MGNKEKELLEITFKGTDEESDKALQELREINSTYHYCKDWDYLVICDKHAEYACCGCNTKKQF